MKQNDFFNYYKAFVYGKNKPTFDKSICQKCGGLGIQPIHCCLGTDCGCLGMPVDIGDCDCGSPIPSDETVLALL